ncbi:MAG: 30S ribosomal protein S21 [Planctomycetes bacterium]|nr:30S ribosomal protein S21 [Planctomycetota bacterium]
MIRVQVRPNEPLEAALRRFKRQCNYAGIFRLAKKHAYHEKSSDKKRREDRERLRNIMMAERKRNGTSSGRSKKRRMGRGKSGGRRDNDQPDFDPLTADTTIQKPESTTSAATATARPAERARSETATAAATSPASSAES